jgi:hypothetical protein
MSSKLTSTRKQSWVTTLLNASRKAALISAVSLGIGMPSAWAQAPNTAIGPMGLRNAVLVLEAPNYDQGTGVWTNTAVGGPTAGNASDVLDPQVGTVNGRSLPSSSIDGNGNLFVGFNGNGLLSLTQSAVLNTVRASAKSVIAVYRPDQSLYPSGVTRSVIYEQGGRYSGLNIGVEVRVGSGAYTKGLNQLHNFGWWQGPQYTEDLSPDLKSNNYIISGISFGQPLASYYNYSFDNSGVVQTKDLPTSYDLGSTFLEPTTGFVGIGAIHGAARFSDASSNFPDVNPVTGPTPASNTDIADLNPFYGGIYGLYMFNKNINRFEQLLLNQYFHDQLGFDVVNPANGAVTQISDLVSEFGADSRTGGIGALANSNALGDISQATSSRADANFALWVPANSLNAGATNPSLRTGRFESLVYATKDNYTFENIITSNVPAGITGRSEQVYFVRQIDNSNVDGINDGIPAVSLRFTFDSPVSNPGNLRLLVSPTPENASDFSDAVVFLPSSPSSGSVTFNNVDLRGIWDFNPIAGGPGLATAVKFALASTQPGFSLGSPKEAAANATANSLNLVAYPNPVANALNLKLQNVTEGTADVSVLDVTGRVVVSKTQSVETGMNSLVLDLGGLASGVYTVRVVNNGASTFSRIVKN